MNVSVKNIKNQQIKRAEVIYLMDFVGNMLMPRLCPKLDIDVVFKDLSGTAYGYCNTFDDEPPRYFELELQNGLTRRTHISLICHEMVHVKQYARKELRHLARHRSESFKGIRYCSEKTDYWDQPWEIEAFGREIGLATRYFDHIENEPKLLKKFLK